MEISFSTDCRSDGRGHDHGWTLSKKQSGTRIAFNDFTISVPCGLITREIKTNMASSIDFYNMMLKVVPELGDNIAVQSSPESGRFLTAARDFSDSETVFEENWLVSWPGLYSLLGRVPIPQRCVRSTQRSIGTVPEQGSQYLTPEVRLVSTSVESAVEQANDAVESAETEYPETRMEKLYPALPWGDWARADLALCGPDVGVGLVALGSALCTIAHSIKVRQDHVSHRHEDHEGAVAFSFEDAVAPFERLCGVTPELCENSTLPLLLPAAAPPSEVGGAGSTNRSTNPGIHSAEQFNFYIRDSYQALRKAAKIDPFPLLPLWDKQEDSPHDSPPRRSEDPARQHCGAPAPGHLYFLTQLAARLSQNCLGFGSDRLGVFVLSSLCNHSCAPTCSVELGADRQGLVLKTAGGRGVLAKGEALTLPYIPVVGGAAVGGAGGRLRFSDFSHRRRQLSEKWRFHCACERCVLEAGESGEDKDGEGKVTAGERTSAQGGSSVALNNGKRGIGISADLGGPAAKRTKKTEAGAALLGGC